MSPGYPPKLAMKYFHTNKFIILMVHSYKGVHDNLNSPKVPHVNKPGTGKG